VKTAAVILAAGQARRFGGDKLAAELKGRPVIGHVLDAVAQFPFDVVICVMRPDSGLVDHLKDRTIIPVVNLEAEQGMGTSLAAGVGALPPQVDAAFICLGDMPGIPADTFGRMVAEMAASGADIVVPVHDGQQGHPVLFARHCFADLAALTGDTGGRALIRSGRYTVATVEGSAGILRDIDIPGDLDAFS